MDNYPAAAGKLLQDASTLLKSRRFDGAGYLAGYVVECVLKTIIQVERGKVSHIHDLTRLGNDAIRLAAQPGQRTAGYITHPNVTNLPYGPPAGWQENLRYSAPGTVAEAEATSWVGEAARLHAEVIAKMKLDGVIP